MGAKDKFSHGKKWMPSMYVAYFGILQKLAMDHGYALCVHGSVMRDFDLIAVPFADEISTHQELLSEIRSVVGLSESANKVFDIIGYEPHGRTCYTIECGGGGYFDISFTPTTQQAIQKIKSDTIKEKEINKILHEIKKPDSVSG